MDVPARGNVLGRVVPARYIMAVLGSVGLAIVYGLKVNLSVAMVGMINHTALTMRSRGGHSDSDDMLTDSEKNTDVDGPFIWSSQVQGVVLSCYFWGYFVSQIPGARIAELFSAKWVMFFSVAIHVAGTLLTPVCAQTHYVAVVVMRVAEGIGGGASFPAMHALLSKWAPPAERSIMSALSYGGISLGSVVSILTSGILTANLGWASVFYVMGGLSLIWCVFWVMLIRDSPQEQPLISLEERKMIVLSLGNSVDDRKENKPPMPWCAVLKSSPFYAIMVAQTCSNCGWYMFLIELPFYLKQVIKLSLTENAIASSLPYLSLWVFSIIMSRLLDWLRAKKTITTTTARKIATLISAVVPATCLLSLCYVGYNPGAALTLMTIGVTSMGAFFSGYLVNHIDIAPNFAGTLMALTNTVGTVPGIVVPIFVGYITKGNQTITAWRIIFFMTVGMYIIEIIVYAIFASGEEQPWNRVQKKVSPPPNIEGQQKQFTEERNVK